MDKKMYELLNNVDIDFDQYEEIPLSSEENKAVKSRILKEIGNMNDNKKRKKISWPAKRMIAAVLCMVILITGTVGASASGYFGQVSEAFKNVFHLNDKTSKVADEEGSMIGKSVTDNGIKITLDAVLGDSYNVAFVCTIQKEDGTAFEHLTDDDLSNDEMIFEEEDISIDKISGFIGESSGESYFYDADKKDHAFQYVRLSKCDQKIKKGMTANIKLKNLRCYDNENDKLFAKGEWKFKVPLQYENQSKNIASEQTFEVDNICFKIKNLSISSVGIHFDCVTDNENVNHNPEKYMRTFDKIDTMKLTFKNGKTMICDNFGSYASEDENDNTMYSLTKIFDKMINMDQLDYITIQGVKIDVNK